MESIQFNINDEDVQAEFKSEDASKAVAAADSAHETVAGANDEFGAAHSGGVGGESGVGAE